MKNSLPFLFIFFSLTCFSQRQLSLNEAETELQKNNLLLLAENYNISASQAAVIQAKIWDQPYLSAEFNVINPDINKYFDVGQQGQKALAIQQLIYLGGKKKNEIAFAKSNLVLAELQFEQLVRNLKFQLKQTFYGIYFDKLKVNSINSQIIILDDLVKNYSLQVSKGNIPLKEVARLESLTLNLKSDKNEILNNISTARQNLTLLTGINEIIEPLVNESELLTKYQNSLISKETLLSTALETNIDYLTSIKVAESQAINLKWQKSLAIPNVTTGLSYDQRGGAFSNQVNLTLGIPIPLWNSNKGNIKIAEAQLQQSKLTINYKKLELQTNVDNYWQLWQRQLAQYQNIEKSTTSNLDEVYKGTMANFQKRNISMLEFTDFMESYNQTSIQINEIKKSLILSGLNINYITNKEIF